jgi:peptidoglycan biosynthesis protein MviN/MurJ (putative lipid II flippase)
VVALAWGLVAGGGVARAIPLARIGPRLAELKPARVLRPLARFGEAAALPVALQGLYLVGVRLAADLGVGEVTSMSYAYFFTAILVAATATALSVVSSAPLTRRDVSAEEAAEHVVHGAWICLAAIAPAAGVFALAGGGIAEATLGDAYSGDVGAELGRLVVAFAPWTVAATAFSLSFPLLYVLERSRVLVPLAGAALAFHIPLSLALREAWGAVGLALALALTTFGVLAVLLVTLSPRALGIAAVGVGRVALVAATVALAAFGGCGLVLDGGAAAVAGAALYAALLLVARPRGLRDAWRHVRALG